MDLPRGSAKEWFGLYVLDKKAGWLESSVGVERREGKKVLVAHQAMVIEVTVGQRTVRREQTETKVYEGRPGGHLLAYSSVRKGDGGDRSLKVECGGPTCKVSTTAEDGTRNTEIPLPSERTEQADAARLAAARCGTVRGVQLAPEDLRSKGMTDRFVGRTTTGGAGVTVPVSIVEELEEGDRIAAKVLVADDGRIVEIRYGDALVARSEPEELARRIDTIDLFNLARVALPGPLPRDVPMSITYGIRGLPASFQVSDPRQRYSSGTGAGETTLTVTAFRPEAERSGDVPRDVALQDGDEDQRATPEIDWNHPEILQLAKRVVGGTTGTWAASRKLSSEVHRRLEKVYGQSRDRASEILRASKGDCTEHTRLFVALARASGIRAREVKGLVYANYGQGGPGLYWHAWPEVRVGAEWIPVDPTFDQDVADATHIALGRGTQVDAAALLGALKVTRAEAKKPELR
jgi:transglutaminase-like putative cysteine protease